MGAHRGEEHYGGLTSISHRYPLLLDQILALTPEEHPDRHDLQRANELILGVAEHINEQKQRYRPLDRAKKEIYSRRESTKSLSSSMTKKFLRSSTTKKSQPSSSEQAERDDMFDTLAHLVDSTRSAVVRFSNEMRDWSKATKAQLDRGSRLQEILKQPQYQPMALEDQVAVLYAATNGFLDDVPVDKVGQWKSDFLQFLHTAHPELGRTIYENRLDRKFPSDDIKNGLEAAIKEFKQTSNYAE